MNFSPQEVLFALTNRCNLTCRHCSVKKDNSLLAKKTAIKFLRDCKHHGIDKIGFTGGEPFLATKLLFSLVQEAIRLNFVFNQITTNGVWFKNRKELRSILTKLYFLGYDGKFCLSVDACHKQSLKKIIIFIEEVLAVFKNKAILSIAYIQGLKDKNTKLKLEKLTRLLKAKLSKDKKYIKNQYLAIRLYKIDFSPVGKLSALKNPWDGQWFKEDYCQGPGNIFYVLPNGQVKPCCGYATDEGFLTIGNIRTDSVKDILINCTKSFAAKIFSLGLVNIRKCLEDQGVKFPGKTSNHCYFCYYLGKNKVYHTV